MLDEIFAEEEEIQAEREAEAARLGAQILGLPIRELSTLKPAVCLPREATLREAIGRMNASGVGCVLVEDGGRLCGIFTERDVLTKVVGKPIDLDREPVDQFMTPEPETLSPEDRVSFALNLMTVGGFRHVPLVDEAGRPAGVVSMRNVVDYMVELFRTEVLNLPPSPRHLVHTREGG
ncbi:MAG: CBS domain-containing protein [Candidatus Binatia bacterium]|nr:CBS domain-containing protein [Candidatus Binatia bacterium]